MTATIARISIAIALALFVACGGSSTSPSDAPDVEYRVGGTTTRASVTYANSSEGTSQATVNVPWSYSFDSARSGQFLYISAQNDRDTATVRVQIYRRGSLFKESESTGGFVIATASGTF